MKNLVSLGLKLEEGRLLVLDQTRLPREEVWLEIGSPEAMTTAILEMRVRGAPLIGVAAALSLARFAEQGASRQSFRKAAAGLRSARPTAVNLMAAVDRLLSRIQEGNYPQSVVAEAEAIFEEDVKLCEALAERGAALIQDGDGLLTHCNTGGLATAGIGTALGAIRRAHEQGKRVHVFVDETRPLLQGARLTAWECQKLGIPFTLICDGMAGTLMRQGKVRKVLVGADRIARNGDFANKIGTYALAILANHHKVPFYCVAPRTTVDLDCPSGEEIPIEERPPEEVRREWSPQACPVFNPAFDMTPAQFVTAHVLDSGLFRREVLKGGGLEKALVPARPWRKAHTL